MLNCHDLGQDGERNFLGVAGADLQSNRGMDAGEKILRDAFFTQDIETGGMGFA